MKRLSARHRGWGIQIAIFAAGFLVLQLLRLLEPEGGQLVFQVLAIVLISMMAVAGLAFFWTEWLRGKTAGPGKTPRSWRGFSSLWGSCGRS